MPDVARGNAFTPSLKLPAAFTIVRVDRSNSSTAVTSSTRTSSVSTRAIPRSPGRAARRSGRLVIGRDHERPVEQFRIGVPRLESGGIEPGPLGGGGGGGAGGG